MGRELRSIKGLDAGNSGLALNKGLPESLLTNPYRRNNAESRNDDSAFFS